MTQSASTLPSLSSQFLLGLTILITHSILRSESGSSRNCGLALGSYYVSPGLNLTYIGNLFGIEYVDLNKSIKPYNPEIKDINLIQMYSTVNIPFSCDCINETFLGHNFAYTSLPGDTYETIASIVYANLTTADWLSKFNLFPLNTEIPNESAINVIVNCSCGDPSLSRRYGLFQTYPLWPGDTLLKVASKFNLYNEQKLLQAYNGGVDFSTGKGIVFIPTKDSTGSYRPFPYRLPTGAIAGIAIGSTLILAIVCCLIYWCYNNWNSITMPGWLCCSEPAGIGRIDGVGNNITQHNTIYVPF